MLKVALICPFNLERLSGTPVRTNLTAQSLNNHCELLVCATGGRDTYVKVIPDVWQPRPHRQPQFRLDRFTKQVLPALRAFQPDAIHLISPTGILSALAYKILHPKVKIITEIHGLTCYEMTGGSWLARNTFHLLDFLSLYFAHHIIAMSYSQKALITQLFGKYLDKKISVIWGPVDLNFIQPMPLPLSNQFTIGYLGNGSFWQGIDLILTAVKQLQNHPQIHFMLGGIQPDLYKIQLPQPLPANLTIIPIVPLGKENEFFSQCHALISSRIGGMVTESQYPYKLSYYLAAGRPIIASDVSDQRLIVEQANCGFIFNPDQPETLAEKILTLFHTSQEKRHIMGNNGRQFAEKYLSLGQLGITLLQIYQGKGGTRKTLPPSPKIN
ncbi:glycosyl transferase group 1 [Gloeomargarita lithophora Alchichica-D10]|uniref:Glycosyl transferase group 1 n=1 Tax=Gloeomargarita lithophora Alchichica-D10 TaxID=1188229 RepID=A0A1J0A923_9CYAN|nr:glycosyltransferase family 4 protein [Gloeomargarita lithophora]APB32423.1 glycosyl transferase group 1 [Gloeomargarita lithophora Alchichica-D10]